MPISNRRGSRCNKCFFRGAYSPRTSSPGPPTFFAVRSLRMDCGGCDGGDGLLDFRCGDVYDTGARPPTPSNARLHTTAPTALVTLI